MTSVEQYFFFLLIAQFLECMFYGIYLITLCMWARVIVSRRKSHEPLNWYLVSVVMWMLMLGTLDVVFGVYEIILFLIYTGGPVPTLLDNTFVGISPGVIRFICLIGMAVVGDGVLLYRCYVIWNRRWYIILFPAVMWLSEIACCIASLCYWFDQSNATLAIERMRPLMISASISTILFNFITTSLLVFAILRVHMKTKLLLSHNSRPSPPYISRVIIETGLVYTSCIFVCFALFCAKSTANAVSFACTIQITGIVFTLLIIRIDAEVSRTRKAGSSNSHSNPGRFVTSAPGSNSQSHAYDSDAMKETFGSKDKVLGRPLPLITVEVNTSEEMEMDDTDMLQSECDEGSDQIV